MSKIAAHRLGDEPACDRPDSACWRNATMKSLALMLVAAAVVGWTSQAEAGHGCCRCAPNVAQQNVVPTHDALSSAPAVGTRSMSVEPGPVMVAAPARYYGYRRPAHVEGWMLPKSDSRKFSTHY